MSQNNRMKTQAKAISLWKLWRWPLVIGLFSSHCFAAAMMTAEVNEKIAWLSIAIPTFMMTFCWRSRFVKKVFYRVFYSDKKTFRNPW